MMFWKMTSLSNFLQVYLALLVLWWYLIWLSRLQKNLSIGTKTKKKKWAIKKIQVKKAWKAKIIDHYRGMYLNFGETQT